MRAALPKAATLGAVSTLLFLPYFEASVVELPLAMPIPFLGTETVKFHPFGLLVMIAILFGTRVAENFARHEGIKPRLVTEFLAFATLLGLFVAAPALNTLFYYPGRLLEVFEDFKNIPETFGSVSSLQGLVDAFRTGFPHFHHIFSGISSFGGFIGVITAGFLWRRHRKMPLMPLADIVAFCFPFGWLFGRLGCTVAHDHPGRVTDFFLAFNPYEVGHAPYLPRHDLGFYEVLWCLTVIPLFLYLAKRPRPRGLFVALLPALYAPVRFFLDFLRTPPSVSGDVRYLGLTPGQFASLALMVAALATLRWVLTSPPVEVPDSMAYRAPDPEQAGEAPEASLA